MKVNRFFDAVSFVPLIIGLVFGAVTDYVIANSFFMFAIFLQLAKFENK